MLGISTIIKNRSEFDNVLDLVKNGDEYKARLDELEKARDELVNERKKLTKAKDLDKALASARIQETKANQLKLSIQADYDAKLKEANKLAGDIIDEAQEKANHIISEASKIKQAALLLQANAQEMKDSIQPLYDEAQEQRKQADTLLKSVKRQRDELKAKKMALNEVLTKL